MSDCTVDNFLHGSNWKKDANEKLTERLINEFEDVFTGIGCLVRHLNYSSKKKTTYMKPHQDVLYIHFRNHSREIRKIAKNKK